MLKWNTNKTLPELERDIIYITYDGRVFADYLVERECGIRFQCGGIDWFNVKLWQYVSIMFSEELGLGLSICNNNNQVKHKFNIGDKIYALKDYEGVDKTNKLIIRTDIKIVDVDFINIGISKRGICIKYTYKLYPEEDCFATLEEAQAECRKRNHK